MNNQIIILDMINKKQVGINNKMFTAENNILILKINPQNYDLTDKVITANFSRTEVETSPLKIIDGIIQLPIYSNLIKYGTNYIQLNFRWANKVEQSGLISWVVSKSIKTTDTTQESIDIISYLISEVNRVVGETGDIKEALDESVVNANTINGILANEVTGTIKVATDTGIDLEDAIEDANYIKGLVEDTIGDSDTAKTNLEGTIGDAGTAQTNLNTKIGEAGTAQDELAQAIEDSDTAKTNLEGTIGAAGTAQTNLNTKIGEAGTAQDELAQAIGDSDTAKTNLEGTIGAAGTAQTNLNTKIGEAGTAQDELAQAIEDSDTAKTNLEGTIGAAGTAQTNLNTKIGEAGTAQDELAQAIGDSDTAKTNLEGTIGDAGTAQTNLNTKIGEAGTAQDELAQAIEDNQIVTQPEFAQHKLDYVEEVGTVANLTTTSKEVVGAINELNSGKANKVQEEWINPTLINGWTGTLQYMKDEMGFVHLRGDVTGGSAVNICILPLGYRTSSTGSFLVSSSPGTYGAYTIRIFDSGYIQNRTLPLANTGYFDGITYKAVV